VGLVPVHEKLVDVPFRRYETELSPIEPTFVPSLGVKADPPNALAEKIPNPPDGVAIDGAAIGLETLPPLTA
jgi:hypothetical protein